MSLWGAQLSYQGGGELPELAGYVLPDPYNASIANGTNISGGNATVYPSGGVLPYTYAWEHNLGASVTFSAGTSATTDVLFTGSDRELLGTLTCVVTDANLAVISPSVSVSIQQGTPP